MFPDFLAFSMESVIAHCGATKICVSDEISTVAAQ